MAKTCPRVLTCCTDRSWTSECYQGKPTLFKCKLPCVYWFKLSCWLSTCLRKFVMRCAKPCIRKTQSGENAQVVTPVWIVAQSQCSWQVSARAVVRSGVGVVSGVDRSPALRLLWVLSALGPVSSSWLVSLDTCTSDSAPSVLLSVTGLDSSTTPKPRPPARCQKTCPPSSSAHLSSAFLPPPQLSSPKTNKN